jgi:hypothetical protein
MSDQQQVFNPPGVLTALPFIKAHGPDIVAFLQGKGVVVYQCGSNADETLTLISADQDVTALMQGFALAPPATRTRDHITAALQARNYGEAITRLLSAITLPDDS